MTPIQDPLVCVVDGWRKGGNDLTDPGFTDTPVTLDQIHGEINPQIPPIRGTQKPFARVAVPRLDQTSEGLGCSGPWHVCRYQSLEQSCPSCFPHLGGRQVARAYREAGHPVEWSQGAGVAWCRRVSFVNVARHRIGQLLGYQRGREEMREVLSAQRRRRCPAVLGELQDRARYKGSFPVKPLPTINSCFIAQPPKEGAAYPWAAAAFRSSCHLVAA